MRRPLVLGLVAIAVLTAANAAYALLAISSSAVDLSGLDLDHGVTIVDLIPAEEARGIPVRLKLYGGVRLSGFGRRDWFSGVIETEELTILDWNRPWYRSESRLVLGADADDQDPAASIRLAALDKKAERLPDYDGLKAWRLSWHETSVEELFLGEPGVDRFAALQCWRYGCYSAVRIGPNLLAHMHLPDFRQHGGRIWANERIGEIQRRVCDLLVDAICWAPR